MLYVYTCKYLFVWIYSTTSHINVSWVDIIIRHINIVAVFCLWGFTKWPKYVNPFGTNNVYEMNKECPNVIGKDWEMRTYTHIMIRNDILQFENYVKYMSFTFKETVLEIICNHRFTLKTIITKDPQRLTSII